MKDCLKNLNEVLKNKPNFYHIFQVDKSIHHFFLKHISQLLLFKFIIFPLTTFNLLQYFLLNPKNIFVRFNLITITDFFFLFIYFVRFESLLIYIYKIKYINIFIEVSHILSKMAIFVFC